MKLGISVNDRIKNHWLQGDDSWVYLNQRSPYRFIKNALDLFGKEEVALISPKDFINSHTKKDIVKAYFFEDSMDKTIEKNIDFGCDVLFYLDDNGLLPDFRLEDLKKQHEVYDNLISQGRIGHMINTIDSKEKNNKARFPDLIKGVPLPRTYKVSSVEELEEILKEEKHLVAKHVFGSDSAYVKLHSIDDPHYIVDLRRYDGQMNEWIFQEKIDIYSEQRMVFLDGKIVGTREIVNRLKPWEDKPQGDIVKRVYVPDKEITDNTLRIAADLDMEFGCIDWIVNKLGKRFFLEANDAGTGLNPKDNAGNYIYDITRDVPEYIYNKYFK